MMWDIIFPNGYLIDLAMWLTLPGWVWTLWTPNKKTLYWILSIIVCAMWSAFDLYIHAYHGFVLNAVCVITLIMGWKHQRKIK